MMTIPLWNPGFSDSVLLVSTERLDFAYLDFSGSEKALQIADKASLRTFMRTGTPTADPPPSKIEDSRACVGGG